MDKKFALWLVFSLEIEGTTRTSMSKLSEKGILGTKNFMAVDGRNLLAGKGENRGGGLDIHEPGYPTLNGKYALWPLFSLKIEGTTRTSMS